MNKIKLCLLLFFSSLLPICCKEVILGGDSIGIKLDYNGLLVIGHFDVNNQKNLNKHIQINDRIIQVGNQQIDDLVDLQIILQDYPKSSIDITIQRDDQQMDTTLSLTKDMYGNSHYGLYLKEETLGIATITYYDPHNQSYGALGHEIADQQGNVMEFDHGSCYEVNITGIQKSTNYNVGQKMGQIIEEHVLGNVKINASYGIFGTLYEPINGKHIEVANYDEISLGKAYCYIEINNDEIKPYEIEIIEKNKTYKNEVKNLKIKIVDHELLKHSGGIIQGMSGSPIIQNNKLIAALTHVSAKQSNYGYALYIGNMLEFSN